MTTNKGIFAALSGITSIALVCALAYTASPAQAEGVPGVADMSVVYNDGAMAIVEVYADPSIAGSDVIISADGTPVTGMTLTAGSNSTSLPSGSTYVVTSVDSGDIAWATTNNGWDPGTE